MFQIEISVKMTLLVRSLHETAQKVDFSQTVFTQKKGFWASSETSSRIRVHIVQTFWCEVDLFRNFPTISIVLLT